MRILFDTNDLISAGLNPNGVPAQAIFKALERDEFVVSQVNIDEFKEKISKKFSVKRGKMLLFVQMVEQLAEILAVPERPFIPLPSDLILDQWPSWRRCRTLQPRLRSAAPLDRGA